MPQVSLAIDVGYGGSFYHEKISRSFRLFYNSVFVTAAFLTCFFFWFAISINSSCFVNKKFSVNKKKTFRIWVTMRGGLTCQKCVFLLRAFQRPTQQNFPPNFLHLRAFFLLIRQLLLTLKVKWRKKFISELEISIIRHRACKIKCLSKQNRCNEVLRVFAERLAQMNEKKCLVTEKITLRRRL